MSKNLIENSLYTTTTEKDDLLKDKIRVADIFWINTLGFLCLHNRYYNKAIFKKYLRDIDKTRIDAINDSAHDMAISLKLANDAKLVTSIFVMEYTKLLYLLKTKPDMVLDENLLRDLFKKTPFDRIRPSSRLQAPIKEWIDGTRGLNDILFDLFYVAKYSKTSNDFQRFVKYFHADFSRRAIDIRNGLVNTPAVTPNPATPTVNPVKDPTASTAPTVVSTYTQKKNVPPVVKVVVQKTPEQVAQDSLDKIDARKILKPLEGFRYLHNPGVPEAYTFIVELLIHYKTADRVMQYLLSTYKKLELRKLYIWSIDLNTMMESVKCSFLPGELVPLKASPEVKIQLVRLLSLMGYATPIRNSSYVSRVFGPNIIANLKDYPEISDSEFLKNHHDMYQEFRNFRKTGKLPYYPNNIYYHGTDSDKAFVINSILTDADLWQSRLSNLGFILDQKKDDAVFLDKILQVYPKIADIFPVIFLKVQKNSPVELMLKFIKGSLKIEDLTKVYPTIQSAQKEDSDFMTNFAIMVSKLDSSTHDYRFTQLLSSYANESDAIRIELYKKLALTCKITKARIPSRLLPSVLRSLTPTEMATILDDNYQFVYSVDTVQELVNHGLKPVFDITNVKPREVSYYYEEMKILRFILSSLGPDSLVGPESNKKEIIKAALSISSFDISLPLYTYAIENDLIEFIRYTSLEDNVKKIHPEKLKIYFSKQNFSEETAGIGARSKVDTYRKIMPSDGSMIEYLLTLIIKAPSTNYRRLLMEYLISVTPQAVKIKLVKDGIIPFSSFIDQPLNYSDLATEPDFYLQKIRYEQSKNNLNKYGETYNSYIQGFDVAEFFNSVKALPVSDVKKEAMLQEAFKILGYDYKLKKDRMNLLINRIVSGGAIKESLTDAVNNSPIPILKNVSDSDIKNILKFNNFQLDTLPWKNQWKPNSTNILKHIEDNKNVHVKLPDLSISKVDVSEENLNRMSIEYRKYYNNKHGRNGIEFLEVFDVNLSTDELNEFKKSKPTPTVIPAFHGTGSIAASMILRFGFKVIKKSAGGIVVTGKMLGDGVYFSNIISKAIQYLGDDGYSRKIGTIGYLFEMDAYIGQQGPDHNSAGTGGDNIRSPEWCVFNPRAQLHIKRCYKVKMVDWDYLDLLQKKYPSAVNEDVHFSHLKGFKNFLIEEKQDSEATTFVFMDGSVPNGKGIIDFDQFELKSNMSLGYSQDGPEITIAGGAETQTIFVPSTIEMIEKDPDGIYTLWKSLA